MRRVMSRSNEVLGEDVPQQEEEEDDDALEEEDEEDMELEAVTAGQEMSFQIFVRIWNSLLFLTNCVGM